MPAGFFCVFSPVLPVCGTSLFSPVYAKFCSPPAVQSAAALCSNTVVPGTDYVLSVYVSSGPIRLPAAASAAAPFCRRRTYACVAGVWKPLRTFGSFAPCTAMIRPRAFLFGPGSSPVIPCWPVLSPAASVKPCVTFRAGIPCMILLLSLRLQALDAGRGRAAIRCSRWRASFPGVPGCRFCAVLSGPVPAVRRPSTEGGGKTTCAARYTVRGKHLSISC